MSITLTSAAFDKSSYAPGDLVTLTIGYSSTDTQANPGTGSQEVAVSVTLTDTAGTTTNSPVEAPSTLYTVNTPDTMAQPVTVSAAESPYPSGPPTDRTWNVVSSTQLTYDADTSVSTWEAVLTVQLPLS